jgi:[protein-PII] uridylyltransferase
LAFRRDTSDDQLVVRFAVDVGSPDLLDMLLILTVADLDAVGPGVFNDWKGEVLVNLYQRTMRHLAGDTVAIDSAERRAKRCSDIRARLAREPDADLDWYDRQIDALPASYLFGSQPEKIAAELKGLHTLAPTEVRASGRWLPDSRTLEFVVATNESITPGIFYRLTGALASQGLQILSAEINTLADGLVFDRFYVVDPDYSTEPPLDRLETINSRLVDALKNPQDAPVFRKVWRSESQRSQAILSQLPTRVRTDNSTSDRFTIFDIFSHDRLGLLYTIARTFFEMGVSISLAKIGTYLDQVVDVFYVTDQSGKKIEDEARLQEITGRLLEAIEAMKD